ncbi:hypothetical protein [Streptosporangium minutum]|uniref:hypothetical protein n=1 Tax=Streptosporangium minutum TaxID=569862 RepID=UPI0013FD4079|nr:hypothetical protein [Streptosporangium minutum]
MTVDRHLDRDGCHTAEGHFRTAEGHETRRGDLPDPARQPLPVSVDLVQWPHAGIGRPRLEPAHVDRHDGADGRVNRRDITSVIA